MYNFVFAAFISLVSGYSYNDYYPMEEEGKIISLFHIVLIFVFFLQMFV